ncbi:MAG: hypothetical protein HOP15_16105 [Planctomycetes bacterium]|nr:hypothetical protein [Planctomycetota bacterium]
MLAVPAARAGWPTDPAAPLVLGQTVGIGSAEHAMALGPDGSTWVAWVDQQCFGALRVQRVSAAGRILMAGGLVVHAFANCTTPTPRLAVCADGSAVVSGATPEFSGGPLAVQRFDARGAALWGAGITPAGLGSGALSHLHGLPDGDALVLWVQAGTMVVQRYTIAGTAVWPQALTVGSGVGSNFRVLSMHDDGAGGVYLVWDSPGAYTRAISTTRVSGGGTVLWPAPVQVTAVTPSSRHTLPATLADGEGGLFVLWTQGAESEGTPVPLRLQHLSADGALRFEPEGRRVSLLGQRQFDPTLTRNGDDLYVAWRHDVFGQQVWAQRMTGLGQRLWGDDGLAVAPLLHTALSRFEARWHANALSLVLADQSSSPGNAAIHLYRLDAQGTLVLGATELSGPEPVGLLAARATSNVLTLTWLTDESAGLVFAQRANPDGSLGAQNPGRRRR